LSADLAVRAKGCNLVPATKVGGSRQSAKGKVKAKGKKRARESDSGSDTELEQPPAKRGRPHGAANYSKEDTKELFDATQKVLPLGEKGWKLVHKMWNK